MMKFLLMATVFFSIGVFGKIEKSKEEKDLPKIEVKLSHGNTVMIEQFLNKKQKDKSQRVMLTLACLKNEKKRRSFYSCDTIKIKPTTGL